MPLGLPFLSYASVDPFHCRFTSQNGHSEVVRWLLRNRQERCAPTRMVFDWAAANGHLEVIKVLHDMQSEGCSARAMNWAAKGGHLETVIWLHDNRAEVKRR